MTRIRKNGSQAAETAIAQEEQNSVEFAGNGETKAEVEQTVIEPETQAGLQKLLGVIDQTVERYSDNENEQQELREGVTSVIREALESFAPLQRRSLRDTMTLGSSGRLDMSQVKMGADANAATAPTDNGTTERAISAATKGAKDVGMGFVDFTQGLITGTFNAVIKATIDQMKAYTDMVADLTKSLKEFGSENVSEGMVSEKLAYLTFTEGENGSSQKFSVAENQAKRVYHLRKLYALAPASGGHKEKILGVFGFKDEAQMNQALASGTSTDDKDSKITDAASGLTLKEPIQGYSSQYQDKEITAIRDAIKYGLAKDGMNQLRQMAREGMARIVITEGEIHTKLTFTMKSDESTTKDSHTEDKTDAGVTVGASAGWGWGKANVDAHYNRLQVNTVDEKSTSNINLATEMIGEVRVKFKTDYKPLNANPGVRESDLAPVA